MGKKKVQYIGFYDRGTGKHQSNTVWGRHGISPTITTAGTTASQQIKILKLWKKESELLQPYINNIPDGEL